MRSLLILGVILFTTYTNGKTQTTRTFLATEDNTLYDPLGSPIENSNGMGDYIFAGVANGNGIRRGLLKFNLTTLPDNITITNAKVTLRVSRKFDNTPYNFELHRVPRFWTEGASNATGAEGNGTSAQDFDCTWTRNVIIPNNPDSTWNNAGGDFINTISAMTEIANEVKATADEYDTEFSGTQLIADVQFMVDNAAFNNGWIIMQENDVAVAQTIPEPPRAAVRFRSANSSPTNFTPKLELTYIEGAPLFVASPSLRLSVTNNNIHLKWGVAGTAQFDSFLLEKSTDNHTFYHLISIEKNNDNYYQYIDDHPLIGSNYYRLHLLDIAGNSLATTTKVIEWKPNTTFMTAVVNNNQSSNLTLKIDATFDQEINVTLYDLHGRLITKKTLGVTLGRTFHEVITPPQKSGLYLVILQNKFQRQVLRWQRY